MTIGPTKTTVLILSPAILTYNGSSHPLSDSWLSVSVPRTSYLSQLFVSFKLIALENEKSPEDGDLDG